LGADKIILENVANLDNMPSIGGFVMILPIKIKDGTEAPVRLVGLIEREVGI
jgi:kynurenine formamidase